jgi:hypothetical protein
MLDKYYSVLIRKAMRLSGNMDEAGEVLHQVFIDFRVQEKCKVVDSSRAAYLGRHGNALSKKIEELLFK